MTAKLRKQLLKKQAQSGSKLVKRGVDGKGRKTAEGQDQVIPSPELDDPDLLQFEDSEMVEPPKNTQQAVDAKMEQTTEDSTDKLKVTVEPPKETQQAVDAKTEQTTVDSAKGQQNDQVQLLLMHAPTSLY
ncbi:unnamed protein product [Symbiodinium sp. CCMP2592]|nr:unnamed protein product [Symbiodinium sp. CCMP2592]